MRKSKKHAQARLAAYRGLLYLCDRMMNEGIELNDWSFALGDAIYKADLLDPEWKSQKETLDAWYKDLDA
jgi:hypothetical protein